MRHISGQVGLRDYVMCKHPEAPYEARAGLDLVAIKAKLGQMADTHCATCLRVASWTADKLIGETTETRS